jgi:hypothetical protein
VATTSKPRGFVFGSKVHIGKVDQESLHGHNSLIDIPYFINGIQDHGIITISHRSDDLQYSEYSSIIG